MPFIILLCVVVGVVAFHNFGGVVFGFTIGLLLGQITSLQRKVKRLSASVDLLRSTIQTVPRKDPWAERQPEATPEPRENVILPSPTPSEPYRPPTAEEFQPQKISINMDEVLSSKAEEIEPSIPKVSVSEPIPSGWDTIVRLYQFLFGNRNPIVVTGVGVLFLGVVFFLSYAVQTGLLSFPIEYRLISTAIFGAGLFGFGYKSFKNRPNFGAAVQGGGVGIIYLVAVFAYQQYHLISSHACLAFLSSAIVGTAIFASVQRTPSLAILSLIGGFLAPFAASSHSENVVGLLLFYTFLNLGAIFLTLRHSWSSLVQFAFVGSQLALYSIILSWRVLLHEDALVAFAAIYTVLFVGVPIVESFLKSERLTRIARLGLTWGGSLLGYGGIALVMQSHQYVAGETALIYAGGAAIIWAYLENVHKQKSQLSISFGYLALLFGAISIPEFYDAVSTASLWAIYACVVAIAADRAKNEPLSLIARGLIVLSAALWFIELSSHTQMLTPMNEFMIGGLVLWSVCLAVSISEAAKEKFRAHFFTSFGALIATCAFFWECHEFVANDVLVQLQILSITLIAAVHHVVGLFTSNIIAKPARALPVVTFVLMLGASFQSSVQQSPYLIGVVLITLAVSSRIYFDLARREKLYPMFEYAISFACLHLLCWKQIPDLLDLNGDLAVTLPAMLAAGLVLITMKGFPLLKIPKYERHLLVTQMFPCFAIFLWMMHSLSLPAQPLGQIYIPFFNILEIGTILSGFALYQFIQILKKSEDLDVREHFLIVTAFTSIMLFLARMVHHYLGVPYTLEALLSDSSFQAALSITWASISLLIVVLATRKGERKLWFTGISILGAVLFKMFLFDLAQISTLARIGSFIGVGSLMLFIGYISPLPPTKEK